ncbi:MAG: hypothetical protein IPP91_12385 [Betaproteobacteria bacterium]|nr:hypothetical protein [Betaproteobacteria bacterium]
MREREPVLDIVERVSEMCFGLFMALTFVGAVSAATAGQDPGRTVLYAALGCNLAWGLVDAVMYLVRTLTVRGKKLTLALAVRAAPRPEDGVRLLRDAMPRPIGTLVEDKELDAIRTRLVEATTLPAGPGFQSGDIRGALGIFFIVVLSTFPVALPFVLMSDVPMALHVSRALTLAMLFFGGLTLARHAGYPGWKGGLGMMALGITLTVAIIALGG